MTEKEELIQTVAKLEAEIPGLEDKRRTLEEQAKAQLRLFRRHPVKKIIVASIAGLALIGCQASEADEPVSPPPLISDSVIETAIAKTEAAPSPTDVPIEIAEDAKQAYLAMLLIQIDAEFLMEAAERTQSGELTGLDQFASLVAIAALLEGVEQALPEISPPPNLNSPWTDALAVHEQSKSLLGQWFNEEILSPDVVVAMEPLLVAIDGALRQAEETLAAELGLDPDELTAERQRILESLPEVFMPTAAPEPGPVPLTSTPLPIGLSRAQPFSSSDTVAAPNWDVQVLELIRGAEAWGAIQAANQFNESAPEGMEYLLVRIRVKSTHTDSEVHAISGSDFKITGDRLIEYGSAAVVEPDPRLDAQLFSDGESQGWSAYLVGQGEGNLILIVDELFNFDDDRLRFIALDEGASISVPVELADIHTTEVGRDRQNPAPFGEKVVTEDWEITINELVRGNDAWVMTHEANQFNDPPDDGMEYIAIKVHVRFIGTEDRSANIDDIAFNTTGSANVLYALPSVVEPDPALDVNLFPGGEYAGWVITQAAQGETDLIAVFEPLFDFSGANKRFLSLEP